MATDSVNISEDAEMAECDGDKVVTMMDVLQEQQDFEEDVNAVLGASDDKNCTYFKGYIKRQALYACLTCCTEAKVDPAKRAGVCLACSLTCHENHELIELYTKRNFRCDCGNPKFNSHPCQFTPDKTDINEDNIYNQNFSGLYCTCHRPYPDPDSTIEDDMIQCIICEDWLHSSHLEAVVPANDQYSEMVCKACMEKNEFLHDYTIYAVTAETGDVDIVTVNGDAKSVDNSLCNGDLEKEKLVNGIEESEAASVTTNGDVVMDEDKVLDDTDGKNDEGVAAETKKDTEQNNLEEKEKPDHDNNQMDLDAESNTSKQEEQSAETTATNEQIENKDTSEDEEKQSGDKSEVTEPEQEDETLPEAKSTEDKIDSTDNKIESTDDEPQKANDSKEQTKTQEEISKETISEDGGAGDKVQENETEQELIDDLKALTDEKADTATEEKPLESEKEDENEDGKTNNEEPPEQTKKDSGDSSEDKVVSESENATGNIEVPDTSQPEKDTKESAEDKTDSVMDAIDELLQTANEAKEKESAEVTSESTESANENKLDSEVPEEKKSEPGESGDKPSTNDTEDVEMSENKTNDESTTESEKKTEETEASDTTRKTEEQTNEDSIETESRTETNEKSESITQENEALIDSSNKLKTLNETDNDLKTSVENDSTDKEPPKDENDAPNVTENAKEHKRKLSTDLTDDITSKKAKLECVRPKGVKKVHKGATFWPSNFRQKLCTCGECLSMYKDLKVLFLTDLEDTVFAYESLGKENVDGGASQYEKGLQALSSLDRTQQINALTEYNIMRDKLLDFLKSFKDRKEIVKEEDIKAFFAGMKPRREPDGVYFCR